MLIRLRRFLRGTRGSVIVEFALVVPIFFIFVWGIMMFSRAYGRLNCLNSALREGARTAAALQTPAPGTPAGDAIILGRVSQYASAYGCQINAGSVVITAPSLAGDVSVGVVNYPLFAGLTFIGGLQNITVSRAAIFRWEYAP
jgi:Flp pilus assembly protein TadG